MPDPWARDGLAGVPDDRDVLVVGTDRAMMARAVARLGELGGGVTVWRDGAELASVALPVAGLMSEGDPASVARDAGAVVDAMAACGCRLNNAVMQHSLLALPVIPELRLTDLGLVDVGRFALVPLIEGNA